MQISKNVRFEINLSNRKYKMVAVEIAIITLIVIISQIVSYFWPIDESLRPFGNDYWLYMVLALIELLLIGLIGFVAGIWHTQWRSDNDVRLIKDLAMEDLSQEKESDRDNS